MPEIVFSIEVRRSYQEYNHLVCKGVEEISSGDYGRAVDTLEAASAIDFHEDPNYMLYPRLALAHFLNGDEVVSKHLLEQSRLVMLMHVGCVPRFVEKERRPPLRHQGIRSGGNLCVFENLAQTLVAVDAS